MVDGLSDHEVRIFTCRIVGKLAYGPERKTAKDFSRANDESVLDYLDLDLHNFADNNVNYLWDEFQAM